MSVIKKVKNNGKVKYYFLGMKVYTKKPKTGKLPLKEPLLSALEKREADNAQDTSSTESVMLEYINKSNLPPEDYIFLIQATSPLLNFRHIENMFAQMKAEQADSALSSVRCKRFFWSEDGKSLNYDYRSRPRRQDFSGMMMENGACYINSVRNIIKDKNRLSGKISVFEMPDYTATEIDEPDDWIILENLMRKYCRP